MKAIILAAGRGTRMGNLTEDTPKPMVLLGDKPKLAHSIENLPDAIDEVVLIVGYLSEKIKEYFGSEYAGRKILYVEQAELDGTGGAIMLVKDLVGEEKFLVCMGDDLYRKEDLEKLLVHDMALLAYETDDAQQFGLVSVDAKQNLLNVIERPHDHIQGLVNTGAYVLSPEYFSYDPVQISDTEYGLPQTLVQITQEQQVHVVTTNQWQPIGSPEQFEIAQKELKKYIK